MSGTVVNNNIPGVTAGALPAAAPAAGTAAAGAPPSVGDAFWNNQGQSNFSMTQGQSGAQSGAAASDPEIGAATQAILEQEGLPIPTAANIRSVEAKQRAAQARGEDPVGTLTNTYRDNNAERAPLLARQAELKGTQKDLLAEAKALEAQGVPLSDPRLVSVNNRLKTVGKELTDVNAELEKKAPTLAAAAQAALVSSARSLGISDLFSISALVQLAMRDGIQESFKTSAYFLKALESVNKIADDVGKYLDTLSSKQSLLQSKNKGKSDTDISKNTVGVTLREFPQINQTVAQHNTDGSTSYGAASKIRGNKEVQVNNAKMEVEVKKVQQLLQRVSDKRDQYNQKFQQADQGKTEMFKGFTGFRKELNETIMQQIAMLR